MVNYLQWIYIAMASTLLSIHSIIICTSHTCHGVTPAVYAVPYDVCVIACAGCCAAKNTSGLADVASDGRDSVHPDPLASSITGGKLHLGSLTRV